MICLTSRGVGRSHESYTREAWDAFQKGDYQAAVGLSNRCTTEFATAAGRLQEQLVAEHAEIPTGAVADRDRAVILRNGVLNDVATCLWIKGRSLEAQGLLSEALAAYERAKSLSYARVWDPATACFWSPSLKARDRLDNLDRTPIR